MHSVYTSSQHCLYRPSFLIVLLRSLRFISLPIEVLTKLENLLTVPSYLTVCTIIPLIIAKMQKKWNSCSLGSASAVLLDIFCFSTIRSKVFIDLLSRMKSIYCPVIAAVQVDSAVLLLIQMFPVFALFKFISNYRSLHNLMVRLSTQKEIKG